MNAIITGATKGIGRAIAEKFAKEGINLAVCSRNADELAELKSSLAVDVHTQVVDVSKKENVLGFAAFCSEKFDTVDWLINNAGVFLPGDLHDEADGQLEKLMETNLYSAYHLTRAILPQLKKQGSGTIVNISSVAGLHAYPQGGSYSISKFALTGFSKNLRFELKEENIKVTTVYPGATWSNAWANSGVDPERIMEANDIAESIFALKHLSPKAVVEDIILRPQLGDL